jgi:dienelactone hydrolase
LFQRALAAVAVVLVSGTTSAFAAGAADYYFWRPASRDGAARPWAVLLPGTSGLSIFNDHEHYFRAAVWLNSRGVDALVIDYHGASALVPAAKEGTPGDRVAAIVADALAVERGEDRMQGYCPGAVIGWALGGSGAWTLASAEPIDPALKAVAMFYPALLRARPYRNALPVLVLQGTADDVLPERELREFVARRSGRSAPVEIIAFEGAAHGFDVPSLQPPRTLRFPPLTGQPQNFAYDQEAAQAAHQALERFLREHGVIGGTCAGG